MLLSPCAERLLCIFLYAYYIFDYFATLLKFYTLSMLLYIWGLNALLNLHNTTIHFMV